MHPQGLWLDRGAGNDTQATLYPTAAAAAAAAGASQGGKLENKRYVVKVLTADVKGAGTDAGVWVELIGQGGSGRIHET